MDAETPNGPRRSTVTTELVAPVDGTDFYATPRISPDGSTLAWLSWDPPDMPWDLEAVEVHHRG